MMERVETWSSVNFSMNSQSMLYTSLKANNSNVIPVDIQDI